MESTLTIQEFQADDQWQWLKDVLNKLTVPEVQEIKSLLLGSAMWTGWSFW